MSDQIFAASPGGAAAIPASSNITSVQAVTSPVADSVAPSAASSAATAAVKQAMSVGQFSTQESDQTVSQQVASQASEKDVSEAVAQVNRVMDAMDKQINFKIFPKTGEMYVQVVNKDTGAVVASIPPENILNFRASFEEALGMLFDTTV